MTITTIDIPQADVLWDVARVPEAILRGSTTTEAIGAYIGAKSARQGLYYARAARILGLAGEISPDGTVELTTYGRAFAQYDRNSQILAMRRLLRESEPTRSVLAALKEGRGLGWDGIALILQELAPLAESTAQRRARTAAAWLCAAGLAAWRDGKLFYQDARGASGGHARN